MATNVDRSLYSAPEGLATTDSLQEQQDPGIDVEIVDDVPGEETTLDADVITNALMTKLSGHTMNLAETMESQDLGSLQSELKDFYDADLRSRKEWARTYQKGMELLGLHIEERTEPWEGACGVVHPMLSEAVVRFQSETITETFPAAGPVRTKLIGKPNIERDKAAVRVQADMNWRLTEQMPEYRTEHERMLFNLPIAGSAFKKIYFDTSLGRQVSRFVPAEDFVISYGASDLTTAERYSCRMRYTKQEIEAAIAAGFYRDIDIGSPGKRKDEIQDAKNKQVGLSSMDDGRYEFVEMHVDLSEHGLGFEDGGHLLAQPYVVTINLETDDIMSVYRNWDEGDKNRIKKQHFVHYSYVPGFGFYGFGLLHLVGGHARSATSLTRQLVDAGTLSNLPGGLKAKGLRIKGDDTPIAPGEWRDAEVIGGQLKDGLFPMPYKEPSMVLLQLLDRVVEDGRRAASTADTKLADMTGNTPVGTTLAVLERTLKVMSAVQARVHATLSQELKLLKALVKDTAPADYAYDVDPSRKVKKADYDIVEIIPVSDPNAATLAQRVVTQQAVLQLATTAPQIYDLAELHGDMLRVVGIRDPERLIPGLKDGKPKDPVSENMAVLMGKPVKVYAYQDHEAHIAVHMAAMQDPKIMQLLGQNPQAQMLMAAGQAHLAEHVAYAYRQRMVQALGADLPDPEDDTIPQELEFQLAGVLAQAASKVLQQSQAETAQQQAQQAAQDPVLMMQQKELELKAAELELKKKTQQDDVGLKLKELGVKATIADEANKVKQVVTQAQISATAQNNERERFAKGLLTGAQISADHQHNTQERHAKGLLTGAQIAADLHHGTQERQLKGQIAGAQIAAKPATPPQKGTE
jgi:hypothetical protein